MSWGYPCVRALSVYAVLGPPCPIRRLTHSLPLLPLLPVFVPVPARGFSYSPSLLVTPKICLHKVFIDRAYDIDVADPTYFTKYARYLNQKAFYDNENATIPDYDVLPARKVVRPEYDDVFEDSNWWVRPPSMCLW